MRMSCVIALLCLAAPAWGQTSACPTRSRLCAARRDRFCLFKLGEPEALRRCLRDNRERLSTPCLGLLKSRGN